MTVWFVIETHKAEDANSTPNSTRTRISRISRVFLRTMPTTPPPFPFPRSRGQSRATPTRTTSFWRMRMFATRRRTNARRGPSSPSPTRTTPTPTRWSRPNSARCGTGGRPSTRRSCRTTSRRVGGGGARDRLKSLKASGSSYESRDGFSPRKCKKRATFLASIAADAGGHRNLRHRSSRISTGRRAAVSVVPAKTAAAAASHRAARTRGTPRPPRRDRLERTSRSCVRVPARRASSSPGPGASVPRDSRSR